MPTPRHVLTALCLAAALSPVLRAADPDETADRAYAVLRKYCAECHARPAEPVKGDLQIFNYKQLTWKRKVVRAAKPDESELFQLVACGSMPPGDRAKPTPDEVNDLKQWIADGAPPEFGESYLMKKIEKDLQNLRSLHQGDPPGRRDPAPFQRYVSFNHLLAEDADPDPALWRDALVEALNHLSRQPNPVRVTPVDPASTLFRFDERDVGWDAKPFPGPAAPFGDVDLFDLVLLEYPYATLPSAFRGDERILGDYLHRAGPVRPILYVRGDWFVCTATQPPLYEDLLLLPRTPPSADGQAARAGVARSKMSGGPQLFERRDRTWPAPDGQAGPGDSWRTFDPGTATDLPGLLHAPDVDVGGLMLFSLPNGFNGYYIAESVPDKGGKRLVRLAQSAPPAWVADPNAPDHVARNGLSCMRCHAHGVEPFADEAATAPLFPGKDAVDRLLAADASRFRDALTAAHLTPDREPLTPVTARFVQAARAGPVAPAILAAGAGVVATPVASHKDPGMPAPVFAPADAKIPLPPLDGLTLPEYPPLPSPPVDVEITAWNYKTEPHEKTNPFVPGDEFALEVKNNGDHEIYFELIAAVMDGRTFIRQPQLKLAAKETYKYPEQRPLAPGAAKKTSLTMGLPPGVDRYVLFASDVPFPEAVLLPSKDKVVADRVVHAFWTTSADGSETKAFDLSHLVKKTLEVRTVEKR